MPGPYVTGATELQSALVGLRRRDVPFALSRAINQVAKEARQENAARLPSVFDMVAPYTRRAFYAEFSTKRDLQAFVGIKSPNSPSRFGSGRQGTYLGVHETGGVRPHTRFEAKLYFAGVLQPGEYVVPASGAKITRGTYVQILSQLGALREGSASNSQRSQRSRRRSGTYFIPGDPGIGAGSGLPRGIWRRNGIVIEPLFWITRKRPTYQPRLHFRETTIGIVRERLLPIARTEVAAIVARNRARGWR